MATPDDECVLAVKQRLEAYGFGQVPGINRVELHRRKKLAIGILVTILTTMSLVSYRTGHPLTAVLARLLFISIELPLLFTFVTLAYDYSLRRRLRPFPTVALSAAVSIGVSTICILAFCWASQRVPSLRAAMPPEVGTPTFGTMLLMGVMIGLVHLGIYALAFIYPFAAHDARVRALEADKLKTAAELSRLRGHLEPHFLLNTLNAIAGLVTEDPREARRLLACLGDLLRDALRDGDEMQSMEQEEAWLRRYAEILESRHKGSLSFRWSIDPDIRNVRIPRLLLQPLVENAVKHGALRRRGGGEVEIRAERVSQSDERDSIVCVVQDNGPGFGDQPIRQGALGLQVVRRRLELKLEGDLRIESSTDGTRAVVAFDVARKPKSATTRATEETRTAAV